MNKDRMVLLVIFVFVLVLLMQNIVIYTTVKEEAEQKRVSAKVASIAVCYNHPPSINITDCNTTAVVDYNYTCVVNSTDFDGGSLTYYSYFINLTEDDFFEILPTGEINFTPNINMTGNFSVNLGVWDASECDNNYDTEILYLEIINENDPPYLATPIPNQSWPQDTTLSGAFDLDDYFADPDEDVLTYATVSTPLDNVDVTINPVTNEVTLDPVAGWTGTEYVMFVAWDPYFANATSNNVSLTLNILEESEPTANQDYGGGGGGGGSGGQVPDCLPRWYCRPWGQCTPENLMYRDCYDLNNCSSDFGKPNVTQYCEFISTCYDGIQGPDEEGIDCGGPCPPCGSCYDNTCNNGEDCTLGLISTPDCGGPCKPCSYPTESCFDGICNNGEDCTLGLTDIPDCGGPCDVCVEIERPQPQQNINWTYFIIVLIVLVIGFSAYKTYPYLKIAAKKRKKKMYEERLMLETKITESILDSLRKIEEMLANGEDIEKIIVLFSALVRKYFKSLFDLGYEFTYQEIMNEINSKNISDTYKSVLRNFFERSLEVEFSGRSLSRSEMGAMISEFKQILSLTSREPLKTDDAQIKNKSKNKIDRMFLQVASAESQLRHGELNKAYDIYVELRKDFEELKPKDKEKLHGFLSRLYEEIRLAREKYEYEHSI